MKPALIIGSGFHRYVLGANGSEAPSKGACLFDWNKLIDETASRMQVARPNASMPPVMRWETLIGTGVQEGYRKPAAASISPGQPPSTIEVHARRHVAKALTDASVNYPNSVKADLPTLPIWGGRDFAKLRSELAWE